MNNLLLKEIRQLLRLALPLIAASLAQMGMEVVDTLMMGRLGPEALASGALGSAIFLFLLVVSIGVLTAVGVLVARHYGAGDKNATTKVLHQGIWVALALSAPVMLIMWFAPGFLIAIGEKPSIVAGTRAFLHGLAFGAFPAICFFALREFVSAVSRPRIVMIVSIVAIPFNALANYILMYGKLGFPALGIAGIGYASSLIEWTMLIALAGYVIYHPTFASYRALSHFSGPQWKMLKEIFQLGLPVGVLYAFETGLFCLTTVMMGYFGAQPLAAHQIALLSLNVAFMPSMGFSQAAAVRVSQELGAKNRPKAKRTAYMGVCLGLICAGMMAICFWLFPKQIIALFINVQEVQNQPVIQLATQFLGICAIFEIMDALQVMMTGILRGLKDTVAPMLLGLLSYWCIGLGAAFLLAFGLKLGGVGIWWGLALGISVSAALLVWRFEYSMRWRG